MSRLLLSLALLVAGPAFAAAQPFGTGPTVAVPGQSMVPGRIGGSPLAGGAPPRVQNPEIFGDTVRERAHGRPYDDSFLTPRIGTARGEARRTPPEFQGRSAPGPGAAEFYAREGPGAIGGSAITRNNLLNGPRRAIIRR